MTLGKIYIGNNLYVDGKIIADAIGSEAKDASSYADIADIITAGKETLCSYLNLYGLSGNDPAFTFSVLLNQLDKINATRYYQKSDILSISDFILLLKQITDLPTSVGLITNNNTISDQVQSVSTNLSLPIERISSSGIILTPIMFSNTIGVFSSSIPQMTSNTSYSFIISSSSNSGKEYIIFDGTNKIWNSVESADKIVCQFPVATTIRSYTVTGCGTTSDMSSWTFEGSNNDTDWDVLDTQTNITDFILGTDKYFATTNSTPYLYYRLNVTTVNGGTSLSIYGVKLIQGLLGTAFSSNTQSSTFDAWKLFNGTTVDGNDCWKSDGTLIGKVGYRFPYPVIVNSYEVCPTNDSVNGLNSFPKNWTFEGSNNEADWTILDAQTNQAAIAYNINRNPYNTSNNVAYSYYQLNITSNNGNASSTSMGEFKLEYKG